MTRLSLSNSLRSGAEYLPGLLLMFLVGYAGKHIAHYIPYCEYVLLAIAIGMLVRNTVRLPAVCLPGIATYDL